MAIVTIKKHEREVSWGAKNKTTKKVLSQYDNTATKWAPGLNRRTGQLRTGMENGQEEAKFEKLLGLEKGSLRITGKFWESFYIIIPEGGLELDTSNPMEELQHAVLKADPTVAIDQQQANMAGTEFVMISTSDVAKSKNTERNTIANAYAKFATISQDEVVDALHMIGQHPNDTDPEICRNALGEIVESTPAKFLAVMGDPFFKDKVWIIKLIKKGIVQKDGVGVGYNLPLRFNDISLGDSIDSAVAYLKSEENQNILIGLKQAEEAINKIK